MPKYIVNVAVCKTQHLSFDFEVEAESQGDARTKVRELGFEKSLNTFKVLDETIYDEEINEEYFDIL